MLSSITVIELEHGLHRAHTTEQTRKRREYLDTVFAAIPVEPFTREMAQRAARIDAEARKLGCTIPFVDLLIGTAALHFGYALGMRNLRHFQMVPNLAVTTHRSSPFTISISCSAVFRKGRMSGSVETRIRNTTLFDAKSSRRPVRACLGDSSITQKKITPI